MLQKRHHNEDTVCKQDWIEIWGRILKIWETEDPSVSLDEKNHSLFLSYVQFIWVVSYLHRKNNFAACSMLVYARCNQKFLGSSTYFKGIKRNNDRIARINSN